MRRRRKQSLAFSTNFGGKCPLVAALLLVSIYKSLTACFLDYGVLNELFDIRTRIAGGWNMFYVHLPLDTQFCWSVVFAVMSLFFSW